MRAEQRIKVKSAFYRLSKPLELDPSVKDLTEIRSWDMQGVPKKESHF